jgi:hypothetical protein
MLNVNGCIHLVGCDKDRKKNSAFCPTHYKEHESSAWVKAWRKYQAEITRVGDIKKVLWSPPTKEDS